MRKEERFLTAQGKADLELAKSLGLRQFYTMQNGVYMFSREDLVDPIVKEGFNRLLELGFSTEWTDEYGEPNDKGNLVAVYREEDF